MKGEKVMVLPQLMGSYYFIPTPYCFYTGVELKRVEDQ